MFLERTTFRHTITAIGQYIALFSRGGGLTQH